jgi:hypothetical protein
MRFCLCLLALAALCSAADPRPSVTVRGKLIVREGQPATIETAEHKLVKLDGDDSTKKVLADPRLNGFEIQAKGQYDKSGRFTIDPIHTHSLLVNKDGHTKLVTYWCDVCTIRAYTPGPCVCCQKETTLDLMDPDHEEHK